MRFARRSKSLTGTAAYLFAATLLGCVACAHKAPPPAPPPPPPAADPAPPPPPPAPKCEALTEACVAVAHVKATIQKSDWTIEPPSGWTYAQQADVTVALLGEASFGIVVYATDPKKATADWEKQVAEVSAKLEVTAKKKITQPKKSAGMKPVGSLKVNLYQFDGATHGSRKGPLLVFSADLPDGKALLGVGFVPEDDTSKADEGILKAIESIASSPAAAAAAPVAGASPAPAAAPLPGKP